MPGATTATGTPGATYVSTQYAKQDQYPEWEYHLLSALGAPRNVAQLEALNLWARKEGLPGDTNNWLALTDPGNEFGKAGGDPKGAVANGVWNYDSQGNPLVVTFPTMSSGISATVKFLNAGYGDIVDELRNPNATTESIGAVVANHSNAWGGDGSFIETGGAGIANPIYTGGSATGPNAGATGGNSSFTQCNSSNSIIGENGVFGIGAIHILNPCQAKAIVAGLTIGVGLVVTFLGLSFMVRTESAQAAFRAIGTNATKAAKVFG